MGKDKKKHKKKSSDNKKRHKKTSKRKSSSDDSSSSEEWVECDRDKAPPQPSLQERVADPGSAVSEHDEWASNPALLACTSREQLRQGREKKNEKSEQDKYMLDKVGRTDRELNPYWKDGGSGLPEENPATVESLRQAHVTVGDQGAAWLRKALQRAREQAQDSGRSLADVVAERWGSLDKLENMIAAAEERDKSKRYNVSDNPRFPKRDEYRDRKHSYDQRDKDRNERYKKHFKERDSKKSFSKPRDSSESCGDDKKYRYEKESERKNERLHADRDDIGKGRVETKGKPFKRAKGSSESSADSSEVSSKKYNSSERDDIGRGRLEVKRKSFKRCKRSSESSDDGSEEDSKKYNKHSKQRRGEKPRRTFSKPRSRSSNSSSEEDEERCRKSKGNNYRQDRKSKSSSRQFSKPGNSSDEDEISHRSKRVKDKESKQQLDRHKLSYDSKRTFVRPHRDSEEDNYQSKSHESKSRDYKSFSSRGSGWRKKVESQAKNKEVETEKKVVKTEQIEGVSSSEVEEDNKTPVLKEEPVLTDKELNELAAKLVKAELLGNQELVEELKAKLTKAREAKANAPKDSDGPKEVVILTQTDAKGFTRPVNLSGPLEPSGGRRKGKKVETHADGKRMRYFADDDKYSLQEMFQREKLNTVEDSNEVFAKLASKGIGRDDSTRDMEDVFEETARVEEGEGRQKARERQKAVEQSRRTARTLDHCQWCLDSQHMLKHLIVAIGTTCYLCVPPYQSLTDYHCLIVPRAHTPCATQLDEDVWAEVQDFRKALVQMFLSLDEDVVFFESARRLNQFPHMILNCVPVPKETGDMAPIYFKKAIQECELEWSNNKKLVDLKGRDVRRAVPKGLPYFAVDFGLDSGYAHVIEDEQHFPLNFAQEIIGGMLDLDHTIWRKQKRQTFEEQSKKVIQLSKLWSPFDITKKKLLL